MVEMCDKYGHELPWYRAVLHLSYLVPVLLVAVPILLGMLYWRGSR